MTKPTYQNVKSEFIQRFGQTYNRCIYESFESAFMTVWDKVEFSTWDDGQDVLNMHHRTPDEVAIEMARYPELKG